MKPVMTPNRVLEYRFELQVCTAFNKAGVSARRGGCVPFVFTFYFTEGPPMDICFDCDAISAVSLLPKPRNAYSHLTIQDAYKQVINGRKFIDENTQINMLMLQIQEQTKEHKDAQKS